MAHEVEKMFSVREVPWHGLGTIVKEAPAAEDAIKLAGLNWKVESRQIHTYNQDSKEFSRVEGYQALQRSDNKFNLSVMKDSYTPLQNEDAFKFFNPFVETGLASFETAGSLRKGKTIWIMATLNKAPIDVGGGDFVKKNLLLSNSHDGTMAVRVGFTPVRVVCNNTLTMAVNSKKSQLLRIRHSSKIAERITEIQGIVNAMDATFEATAEQYKSLAKTDIGSKELEQYVNIIFELNPMGSEREKSRYHDMQRTITSLFENGAGQHMKSAKGTYWGAYNAVTEYLTHDSSKNAENRLHANWYGNLMKRNEHALNLALEAV